MVTVRWAMSYDQTGRISTVVSFYTKEGKPIYGAALKSASARFQNSHYFVRCFGIYRAVLKYGPVQYCLHMRDTTRILEMPKENGEFMSVMVVQDGPVSIYEDWLNSITNTRGTDQREFNAYPVVILTF